MQQSCTYGSVRGALGNRRPYRDRKPVIKDFFLHALFFESYFRFRIMSLEGSAYPPRPCTRFSRGLDSQVSHANQVVRSGRESEHPSHQILSA